MQGSQRFVETKQTTNINSDCWRGRMFRRYEGWGTPRKRCRGQTKCSISHLVYTADTAFRTPRKRCRGQTKCSISHLVYTADTALETPRKRCRVDKPNAVSLICLTLQILLFVCPGKNVSLEEWQIDKQEDECKLQKEGPAAAV
ncbi:hypothetical protein ElyMa_001063700 [Elysia marginata]|uniref:Uncharacterized protein n=1 Tax=Elysia marginata TaxID=1093978 RepID=A0AAV4HQW9_9GAST|nr:hypothetical protein ElyMa_001063700 [Elysia marginata]